MIKTVEARDQSEFLALLHPGHGLWQPTPHHWVFRGQSDAAWKLVPTLLRNQRWKQFRPRNGDGWESPSGIWIAESKALTEFVEKVNSSGLAVPEFTQDTRLNLEYEGDLELATSSRGVRRDVQRHLANRLPPRSLWSQFALGQHYGVPTRFLDWSESPYVAAYFAVSGARFKLNEENSRNRLAVWALDVDTLHTILQDAAGERRRRDKGKAGIGTNVIEVVRAPYVGNPNLAAQRGLFTLDRQNFEERGFD